MGVWHLGQGFFIRISLVDFFKDHSLVASQGEKIEVVNNYRYDKKINGDLIGVFLVQIEVKHNDTKIDNWEKMESLVVLDN